MKITAVKGIGLRCACEPIHDALSTSRARQALLVVVETDAGLCGVGEAFTYGAPLAAAKAVVEEQLAPRLVGRDALRIAEAWDAMHWGTLASGRRGITMGAVSGVDIALWDLRGKAEHKPVSALLGGVRDRIPSYASGGFYAPGKDTDALRRELEGYMRIGYRDAKIKIGRTPRLPGSPLCALGPAEDAVTPDEDWRRVEAARETVDGWLAVDTNASWDAATALQNAPELVRLGVSRLEEPIPFEDVAGFARLRRACPGLLVMGCETQQGEAGFSAMLDAGALDIVQPDAGWAGGITECVRIGRAAAAHGCGVSLHCFGSAVLFAASLHLCAALPGLEPLESEENPNPLKTALTRAPFEADGHMNWLVPQGDGLGIELDPAALETFAV